MFTCTLRADSRKTLCEQLYEALRRQIGAGGLADGEKLPSKRALAAHLVYLCYFRMCRRQFGGLSGDLAGWFLVQAEKWMLIALTLWQFVEVLL